LENKVSDVFVVAMPGVPCLYLKAIIHIWRKSFIVRNDLEVSVFVSKRTLSV
jgi:hypothetical protein